jgi:hypothetical protein
MSSRVRRATTLVVALMVTGVLGSRNLMAQTSIVSSPNVGAWFGIARA